MGGRKENQDTLFSLKIRSNGQRLWAGAVFDGHGREGKAAAEYARDRVQQVVEEQAATLLQADDSAAEGVLRAAFAAAHSGMGMFADCSYSGTTATVCVLLPTRQTHL